MIKQMVSKEIFMSTVHNNAKVDEIAENVIMPGDPLRAKYIAENFLKDAKLVSTVRNMFCYTGEYNGKKITVMGSGMGMPSMAIYAEELFSHYGAKNIIRVGSAGAIDERLKLFDVIIVKNAHTTSNFGKQLGIGGAKKLPSSKNLFNLAIKYSKNNNRAFVGDVLTTDVFYDPYDEYTQKTYQGKLAVEMETFGLFAVAKKCGKNAMSILTISDIVEKNVSTSAEQREKSFMQMVELALKILTNE